jgi:hypothetical protein
MRGLASSCDRASGGPPPGTLLLQIFQSAFCRAQILLASLQCRLVLSGTFRHGGAVCTVAIEIIHDGGVVLS